MKLSRPWLAGILTTVAAALLALLPVSAGAFTLGLNDRWDTNSAKAHWIRDIGGTDARVFVSVTRSADPSYWNFLAGEVGNLRAAGVQPTWVLSDIPSYGGCNTHDLSVWQAAARALIARYPSGAIEIENEPNFTGNTSGTCSEYPGWSADLYAKVFRPPTVPSTPSSPTV